MDISAIASLAIEMATVRTEQAAQLAVLKRAMELQGQGAIQLLATATQTYNNPPHLDNRVDTFA